MDRIGATEILLDARKAIEEALQQARIALRACEDEFLCRQALDIAGQCQGLAEPHRRRRRQRRRRAVGMRVQSSRSPGL